MINAELKNMVKFPLKKNSKLPACKWKNKQYHTKNYFKPNRNNTGIMTGYKNNLIVLDVDVKDDGIIELNEYISEFGNLDTLTIETPSRGKHYYFSYNSSNIDNKFINK